MRVGKLKNIVRKIHLAAFKTLRRRSKRFRRIKEKALVDATLAQ